jgi:hypothetical protein
MRASRFLLLLVVAGVGLWILKSSGIVGSKSEEASSTAPIDRARAVAKKAQSRDTQTAEAAREAESTAPGAGVTENMTPEQVRALLGSPDDVTTETTDTGRPREKWLYRSAGKTVTFENGIVVSVN